MNAQHIRIKDVRLVDDGLEQSVMVEFGDGQVRSFSARELYDTSRSHGQAESGNRTAAQRRAEDILSARRGRSRR